MSDPSAIPRSLVQPCPIARFRPLPRSVSFRDGCRECQRTARDNVGFATEELHDPENGCEPVHAANSYPSMGHWESDGEQKAKSYERKA
jgi:hypothetical protein